MENLLRAFVADWRVQTIFWLIVFEVGSAVILAIKQGSFDAHRLANYYRSKVVPYVLGAALVYVVTRYLPTQGLGPYSVYLNEGLFTIAWLTLIYTLVSDAWANLRAIGYGLPADPQPPDVPDIQPHG